MPEGMKIFLDQLVQEFQVPGFIIQDPISIPHRFSIKQDIEMTEPNFVNKLLLILNTVTS